MHSSSSFNPTPSLEDADEPLPSVDIQAIRQTTSEAEVDTVFHVTLEELTSPGRLRPSLFRADAPYWAVGVDDIVHSSVAFKAEPKDAPSEADSEIGPGKFGKTEIWGLSGWYLTLLMRDLGIWT